MGVCSELIRLPRDSIPNKLTGLCRDSSSDGALSPPRCYTENAALNGSWVFDNSAFKLPYVMQSSSWSTHCDKFVRDWMNGIAPAPDYMRYRWTPQTCTLPSADNVGFCQLLFGKTISFVGDSMMQQFFSAFVGMLFGFVPSTRMAWRSFNMTDPIPPVTNCKNSSSAEKCEVLEQVSLHICNGNARLRWLRCDLLEDCAHNFERVANVSDILVVNWGVHYTANDVVQERLSQLTGILSRSNMRPGRRVFWRATIASHRVCNSSANAPAHKQVSLSRFHHANDIVTQDQVINWPQLRRAGVEVLRVQESSLLRSDGHTVNNMYTKKDCLHYCLPGVPDMWVALLHNRLKASTAASQAA